MDYEKHLQLSFTMVRLYQQIEEELLTMVAKRLKLDGSLTEMIELEDGKTTQSIQSWQTRMLNDLGPLRQEAIIEIAKRSQKSMDEVVRMLHQAGYDAVNQNEGIFEEAFEQGLLNIKPPKPENSAALLSILKTYEDNAHRQLNLINSSLISGHQQVYRDIINETVAHTLAGIKTPQKAITDTVKKWAHKGVPTFTDKANKTWSTEAYVTMVMRSMNNNVANDMQFERMDEYNAQYLETSSHTGARPGCEPYQGRIYYRGPGTDPLGRYPHFGSTSYGEAAGLLGINCGHTVYPYIPGLSTKTFNRPNAAENAEAYADRQKQRYLERRVRGFKREERMFSQMGDKALTAEARAKKENEWAKLRSLTKQTGMPRRYDREKIL
ncbi:phage minor capsid protein [Salinicoccus roseus]|uniref:Minor capsid protein n=1 Tax=Salinicoccus roseus TaxID=45670 RepID=A0A0C2DJA4_9STAP|nr:phage minor capsid protein [Salinicoccus roseus]KIH70063.1 hypothetical protein SN16_11215 [Salinicoccus roseus]MDB0581373.1 minor capsid protein [Salinicoccus roseus]